MWGVCLLFQQLPVWHHLKFLHADTHTGIQSTAGIIHAYPAKVLSSNLVPARFDTAWINGKDTLVGDIGIEGIKLAASVLFSQFPRGIPGNSSQMALFYLTISHMSNG